MMLFLFSSFLLYFCSSFRFQEIKEWNADENSQVEKEREGERETERERERERFEFISRKIERSGLVNEQLESSAE